MNPLDSYPNLRRILYVVQWLTNLVLGIVSIVLVALGDNPMWWVIVQAVFNFVWTYTGLTAQTNVADRQDGGNIDEGGVIYADDTPPTDEEIADLPTYEVHGTPLRADSWGGGGGGSGVRGEAGRIEGGGGGGGRLGA